MTNELSRDKIEGFQEGLAFMTTFKKILKSGEVFRNIRDTEESIEGNVPKGDSLHKLIVESLNQSLETVEEGIEKMEESFRKYQGEVSFPNINLARANAEAFYITHRELARKYGTREHKK